LIGESYRAVVKVPSASAKVLETAVLRDSISSVIGPGSGRGSAFSLGEAVAGRVAATKAIVVTNPKSALFLELTSCLPHDRCC
jgi:hypothetical protein